MLTEQFQIILQNAIQLLPRIVAAVVVFVLGVVLANAAASAIKRTASKRIEHPETVNVLSRLVRWAIIALAAVIALDQVNFDVTAFLTGLGIAGVTIGFALQDIAQNFVAGIILLLRRPFSIGQAVNIAGFSGSVLDVQVRDTTIRTWDGEVVVLPNKQVLSEPITNYSQSDNRRRTIIVGLSYEQDLDQIKETLLQTVSSVEGVLQDPAPMLHGEELGDYTVNVAIRFWLNQRTHSLLDVHSDVVFAIQKVARERGIDLPYPIQVVHLPDMTSASKPATE